MSDRWTEVDSWWTVPAGPPVDGQGHPLMRVSPVPQDEDQWASDEGA